MQQKVIKTGNSLAVTIPSQFAKILGVRPGLLVDSHPDVAAGVLTLVFPGSAQLPLLSSK